jgi:hypothetical protein
VCMYCFYSVINFHWGKLCKQQKRMEYRIRVFILFVLYHHTVYVISLSNISIKRNFKQIARVEFKCVQYSEGDYILCMTSLYFFRSFTNVRLLCFVSHSNGMTSCQSSSTENVSCNVAPFFYQHSVVIQHLVSDALYQTGYFPLYQRKTDIMLDKYPSHT